MLGTWLAQFVEHVTLELMTLELRAMSSSRMLGMENYLKKDFFKRR